MLKYKNVQKFVMVNNKRKDFSIESIYISYTETVPLQLTLCHRMIMINTKNQMGRIVARAAGKLFNFKNKVPLSIVSQINS